MWHVTSLVYPSRFCMWSWLGKQRIKVRTIDESGNLVSSGRKILRSCDRQGHVTCVWQMRGCWQVSPTFSGPRENRYPAKITTDDISPLFQSLTGERIYGMEIYAVFVWEKENLCFLEPFCPSEAIPQCPSGVHGERAANSHAWRHTLHTCWWV